MEKRGVGRGRSCGRAPFFWGRRHRTLEGSDGGWRGGVDIGAQGAGGVAPKSPDGGARGNGDREETKIYASTL